MFVCFLKAKESERDGAKKFRAEPEGASESGWHAEREEVSDQLVTCKKKPERPWGWADLDSGSPPS